MQNNKSFKRFLLLWTGGFISSIGNGLTSFGLGVYIFERTGMASATSLVTLFAFLPTLILSPLAGVLADRYDRRILMVIGDGCSAMGLLFILVCIIRGDAGLWQICAGVSISSIFASLLEPAFKATITDLLTAEQYTQASGFVQVSGSAKFLISPIIAGFLLTISDIKLLLIIDICTIFVTVVSTLVVRKGLVAKKLEQTNSLIRDFHDGLNAISSNRGVMTLAVVGAAITFFIGAIQTLFTPMILSFADSSALGTGTTLSASGLLLSSVFIGAISIRKNHVKILIASLFLAGIFMMGFGLRENIRMICLFGFLFFSMLPFANTSIDYLVRTNINNDLQGRVWGLVSIISQLGYVLAYASLGLLADYVFTPLLVENGVLSGSIGRLIGVGPGRGTGFLIIIAGFLLALTAALLYRVKSVRRL